MTQPLDLDTLIAQVNEQAPEGDALDALEAALDLNQQLGDLSDKVVSHFVDEARRQGHSWSEIGGRMGVSKQAARKRFVDTDPVLGAVARRRPSSGPAMVSAAAAPAAGAVGIRVVAEPSGPAAGTISVRAAAPSSAAPAGLVSAATNAPQFDVAVRPAASDEAASSISTTEPHEAAGLIQAREAIGPDSAPAVAGVAAMVEMAPDEAAPSAQYLAATAAEPPPYGAVLAVDPVEPAARRAVGAFPVDDATAGPAVVMAPAPAPAAVPAGEPVRERATRGDGERPAASLEHSIATCTSCGASSAEPRYVARRDGLVICLDCLQDT